MPVRPQMKRQAPGAPASKGAGVEQKDRLAAFLLPSWRVAVFRIPRVREIREIREAAIAETTITNEDIAGDNRSRVMELGTVLERHALRRLLHEYSEKPAPVVTKGGVALGTVRAEAEARAREDAKKTESRMSAAELDDAATQAGDRAVLDALDAKAMVEAAVKSRATDAAWELDDTYLRRMPEAYAGEPEARDWEAIHTCAAQVLGPAFGSKNLPKSSSESPLPTQLSATYVG